MTLSATWMVPVPANGEISVYTINCTETESGTVVPAFSVSAPSTSTTLMGLTAYTEYSCVISATTGAGEGNLSGPQTAMTDEDSKLSLYFQLASISGNSTACLATKQEACTLPPPPPLPPP